MATTRHRKIGPYRVLGPLGQGGMATIYRARDAQLDRDVAVKLLRPEFGQDPDFLARFRDEARAAASLNHPNIVSVFDFGDRVLPDGRRFLYMVMEFVDGITLAQCLKEMGTLLPTLVVHIALQVAKALREAHRQGIVHRDIKPSNIMIGPGDRVILTDFGIARLMGDVSLTMTGQMVGTPAFMAPEVIQGHEVDGRADVYALGRILHDWSEEKIRALLAKIVAALPAGGGLVIAERLLDDDKTGPLACQLQSLNMLACTEGKERTADEYRALLLGAGFADVKIKRTGSVVDALLAVKG